MDLLQPYQKINLLSQPTKMLTFLQLKANSTTIHLKTPIFKSHGPIQNFQNLGNTSVELISIMHKEEMNIGMKLNNKKEEHTTRANISGIQEELLRNQQNIVNNKKDINTTQDSIRDIQEELLRNQQNIENVKEELQSKQDSMKSIQDELLSNLHNTNISSIWTVLSNVSTAVMDMKDDIDKGKTDIKQIKSLITKLHHRSCRDVNSTDDRVVVTLASGLKVMCDTKTDGGGWIIFQRRINGNVDFYRGWKEYRDGFGDYNIGEFYLGNENIYMLTSTGQYNLRIDLKYENKAFFAQYSSFKILSEKEKYKLNIGVYSGNAGDSFSRHNNSFFSTFDRDNDEHSSNCAVSYTGAWWYHSPCHSCNLNGKWGSSVHGKGVIWYKLSRKTGIQKEQEQDPVRNSETGIQRQEFRDRNSETGIQRQELRDRNSETGIQELGFGFSSR
nr:Fibrinogen C domain-containing protein 1-like; partial Resistant factor [Biomphalaria glabrata]